MSVNAVDQTTGNTTPLAGNTNNLVGNLSALTTNTKSDAVGAINEVNQTKQNATDNNLQTTDKTIVGGINELRSGLTSVTEQANKTVYQGTDRLVCFSSVEGTIVIMCHNPTLEKSIGIQIAPDGSITRYDEADV